MALLKFFFLVSLLLVGIAHAGTLNNTFVEIECAEGCTISFLNNSIWDNLILPGPTDAVNISLPIPLNGSITFVLPANSSYHLQSLSLTNVSFSLAENASLSLTQSLNTENSAVTFSPASSLAVSTLAANMSTFTLSAASITSDSLDASESVFSLLPSATLSLASSLDSYNSSFSVGLGALLSVSENDSIVIFSANSDLMIYGSFLANGSTTLGETDTYTLFPLASAMFGTLVLGAPQTLLPATAVNATVSVQKLVVPAEANVALAFSATGLLTVQNVTLFPNSTLTISGPIVISQVEVPAGSSLVIDSASGTIGSNASSVFGNGSVSVSGASSVTFASVETSYLNGTLALNDNSTVFLNNFYVQTFTTSANTNVFGSGLVLAGNNTLLGAWSAVGDGINITAQSILVGTFAVVTRVVIEETGILSLGASQLTLSPTATILLGGFIQGNVNIALNNTLEIFDGSNTTVMGNIVNDGQLILTGDHPLHVFGSVTLNSVGTVHASLTGGNDVTLQVYDGSLALAGNLFYNLVKKPFLKSEKYLLAEVTSTTNSTTANYTITGTFNGTATALKGSEVSRALKIEYHPANVYVLYGFKVNDVAPWVWVVLSLIIVVLVAAVIGIIFKCRSRRNYQPVP